MASRGVNKVILVGNLGKDPETRYFPSGGAVTNITIATSESWKDKQTGENQERTEWHRVSFFGRLAEIAGEYLRKGSKVFIEGRLQTRKWQDQSGNDRYSTEIVANEMQMLDSRNSQSNNGGYEPPPMTPNDFGGTPSSQNDEYQDNNASQSYANPNTNSNTNSNAQAPKQKPAQETSFSGMDDLDDDIPF